MKSIIKFICIILCISAFFLSCDPGSTTPSEDSTPSPTPVDGTPEPTPDTTGPDTVPAPVISVDIDGTEFNDTELFIKSVVNLTASGSGATATYNWSLTGGGSFNVTTGATVVYTGPSMPGPVTISCIATDGDSVESEESSISYTIYDMEDSVLWLDAMNVGSLVPFVNPLVNGMGIDQWNDRSGNDNTADTPPSRSLPIYFENMVNGHPVLRFHENGIATNPYFTVFESASLDLSDITFFIIAKQSGIDTINGQTNHTIMAMDSGFSLSANEENTEFSFIVNGEASASFPNTDISDFAVISGVYNRDFNLLAVWVDGEIKEAVAYSEGMNCSGNLHIGGNGTTDSGTLEGYIGEVIIFDKAISNEQIVFISGYLSAKWGISVMKK
ncbi:MAG: hypothetical protein JXJ04_04265 [Spirochaetales bacterium]|nr:hypothetical protein [Spirochaetales bacterium]